MTQLPIDAVPDVTNVQVQILTNSPGLAPEEVAQFGRLVGLWHVETEMARQGGGWVMSMQRHIPCGAPECFHGPRVILCNPNKAKAVNKMQAAPLLRSNWRLS